MTYILYATDQRGDGSVTQIGKFDNIEDIEIKIWLFQPEVSITIEEESEE